MLQYKIKSLKKIRTLLIVSYPTPQHNHYLKFCASYLKKKCIVKLDVSEFNEKSFILITFFWNSF